MGGKKIIRTLYTYIDVSKNVRIRGCFSRPEGVRDQIRLGNIDLAYPLLAVQGLSLAPKEKSSQA